MTNDTSRAALELTTRDAAKLAGVTDGYIRRLLGEEVLLGRKLNDWLWLVDRRSFDKWMEQRKPRPGPH